MADSEYCHYGGIDERKKGFYYVVLTFIAWLIILITIVTVMLLAHYGVLFSDNKTTPTSDVTPVP